MSIGKLGDMICVQCNNAFEDEEYCPFCGLFYGEDMQVIDGNVKITIRKTNSQMKIDNKRWLDKIKYWFKK